MAPSHTRSKSIASVVMVQPTFQEADDIMDPYAIACPTFGCRGDCFVCDPERKGGAVTAPALGEGLEIGSTEVTEDGCPIWNSCQQKRARFMKKPLLVRLFGLTAITTVLLALQSYGKVIMEKVSII